MSVRLQRPQWVAPHSRLIGNLGIRDLWVPQGIVLRNLAGGQGDLAADTLSTRWSTGPGGYGLDTTNSANQGYSTSSQVCTTLLRTTATMFGVVSVRSATTGQIYRFGYGGDTRYSIRVMFDATNGLKTTNISGAYASTDEQSMGVLPPLNHPFAFVALYSYPYQGAEDVREIYDSFGNRAPAAASNASWDAIDCGYVRVGNDFTNSIDGHIYMAGLSERLWKQSEIQDFLADPYRLIDGARQRSRQFFFVPAGGTAYSGAADLSGVGGLNGDARRLLAASSGLSGVGNVIVDSGVLRSASAAMSGVGTVDALASALSGAGSALTGIGTLSSLASVGVVVGSALTAQGVMSVDAARLLSASGALIGAGDLGAAGIYSGSFAPDADITDGGWTDQSGGTNLFAAVDELLPDDADYIKSATLSAGQDDTCVLSLTPMSDPGSDDGWAIRYRIDRVGAAASLAVTLKSGTTTIASWNETPTGSPQTIERALTPLQISNITDFADLRVELTAAA